MKLNRRSADCGTSGTAEPAESLNFQAVRNFISGIKKIASKSNMFVSRP